MKSVVPNVTIAALTACALLGGVSPAFSQSQVYVDPGQTWLGYMNWFENNGGAQGNYAGGGAWGTADLPAVFSGGVLGLAPNINVYDPNNSYWVNPDGTGTGAVTVESTPDIGNAICTGSVGHEITFSLVLFGHGANSKVKFSETSPNYVILGQGDRQ